MIRLLINQSKTKISIAKAFTYKFSSKNKDSSQTNLTQTTSSSSDQQIIKTNYEQTNLPGSDVNVSKLSKLQSEILASNKFDLTNPQIQPKMSTINTYAGLSNLTQINLGQVQVKKENQVFLSEVDPNNIPQQMNIRFDMKKTLVIVGKKTNNSSKQTDKEMEIQPVSFEQKTVGDISEEVLGARVNYELNKFEILRSFLLALPIYFIVIFPLVLTLLQYQQCINSIQLVQGPIVKQIKEIKSKNLSQALRQRKDFNRYI